MLGRCRRRVLVLRSGPAAQPALARAARLSDPRRHRPVDADRHRPAGAAAVRRRAAAGRRHRRPAASTITTASRSLTAPRKTRRYLLIATGVIDDLPAIPGFDECYGRSIFHCPYCDGWERRDRPLAAFGRGARGRRARARAEDLERRRRRLHARRAARAAPARAARTQRHSDAPEPIARIEHARRRAQPRRVRVGRAAAARRPVLRDRPASAVQLAITLGCTLNRRGTVKTGSLCDTNVPRRVRRRRRLARRAVRRRRRRRRRESRRGDQQGAAGRGARAVSLKPPSTSGRRIAADPKITQPQSSRNRRRCRSSSAALTVLAVLAIVLVLQYAQAMIIPIVLGVLISYALEPMVAWLERRHIPRAAVGGGGPGRRWSRRAGGCSTASARRPARSSNSCPTAAQTAAPDRRARSADGGDGDSAGAEGGDRAREGGERGGAAAAAVRRAARAGRDAADQHQRLRDVGLARHRRGARPARADPVPRLFPAGVRRPVPPQAGEDRRAVADREEGHGPDPARRSTGRSRCSCSCRCSRARSSRSRPGSRFRALGVQQAAVWGLLAGMFNSIPVLRAGARHRRHRASSRSCSSARSDGGCSSAAWRWSITSLEGFLLTPWLTSRAARMNAVAIFVGLLFWGWVWNVWGMLLAVPMLMVIKAVCDHVEDFKGVGELLGD